LIFEKLQRKFETGKMFSSDCRLRFHIRLLSLHEFSKLHEVHFLGSEKESITNLLCNVQCTLFL
jgi:hypothetical protein